MGKFFIFLVSIGLSFSAAAEDASTLIYGGFLVPASSWLAQSTVALSDNRRNVFCSGVVIGSATVLTAAHCLNKAQWVNFGINAGGTARLVTAIFPHPNFSAQNGINDIGVLYFKDGLPSGFKAVSPSGALPAKGNSVTVAGFGTDVAGQSNSGKGVLRTTKLTVINPNYHGTEMVMSQIGGTGICYSDSGGPAFLGSKLIAVAHGVSDTNCKGSSAFTLTAPYLAWIRSKLR